MTSRGRRSSDRRPGAFDIEPPRTRPDSPSVDYGVPPRGGRFVGWSHVTERLATADAYWLCTVTPDGQPHAVPIWGCLVEGDLYLETGAPQTIKNRNLESNRSIVVHLDGTDDVVIVRGTAQGVRPDPTLGSALAEAMHRKYPEYDPGPDPWDAGGMIRIVRRSVLAWTDMPTATRWRFEGAV
jgi:hypothetical protein